MFRMCRNGDRFVTQSHSYSSDTVTCIVTQSHAMTQSHSQCHSHTHSPIVTRTVTLSYDKLRSRTHNDIVIMRNDTVTRAVPLSHESQC